MSGITVPLLLPLLFGYFLTSGNCAHIQTFTRSLESTCGYAACPTISKDKLNIHLVPHTHDDVGWLKTVDQYYFGSQSLIQKAGVQYILDTVIEELLKDPQRRFIYVETAFLWKWWLRQNDEVRQNVKTLINEGRLEIISGGWSMNDEGSTHYHSVIDQFTWGFRRLNDTFGTCARPHIGWQIDPFGHSREQASMFAQMGFDGMFIGRLDYQDKLKRLSEKSAEFIWKASPSLGGKADLFTGVLFNNYSPPPGFCFDVLCADEPLIDDPDSPDNNIAKRIDSFLNFTGEQARHYRTNNAILTMGGDFTYQHAQMWFKNLDSLIRYTNARNGSTVNVFYSTPSCYLKALHDANLKWPTKTDDFFPYASDPHAYWTGYFTSRPTLKFFERMGNNLLQVCKQLSVLAHLDSKDEHLSHFREAMGMMQHHDAITGTEKQKVASDYARILYASVHQAEHLNSDALRKILAKEPEQPPVKFYSCLQLNISSCKPTEENKQFVVTLYNSQSRLVSTYVRLPVQGNSYSVKNSTGTEITSQIVPIPETVLNIPGRKSTATKELVFYADEIPPLGYLSFYVTEKVNHQNDYINEVQSDTSIGNSLYDVSVTSTGEIQIQWKNEKMKLVQSYHYYEGAEGNNKIFANRSSGAYIFRPKKPEINNLTYSGSFKIYKGPLVQEIHQTINDWVSQVLRIYNMGKQIEFHWLVGPIPVGDKIGKELVSRYSSNLKSEGTFYTDSNGREMIKRLRNYRPTWQVKLAEPVSGNYYPVTSKIYLEDPKQGLRLNVLNDRAQGGTSMQDGELELMLHRRLLSDDAFGVGEALNEEAFGKGLVARGTHYIFGASTTDKDNLVLEEKTLALKLALQPWTFVSPAVNLTYDEWKKFYKMTSAGEVKALPPNVHILTLEPWKEGTILLRLEHLFEVNEAQQLSQPVTLNITDILPWFTVTSVHETTLGANQWLEDEQRLKWESEANDAYRNDLNTNPQRVPEDGTTITLKPMEIRTFIVEIKQ
ncbi:lysosomal alpha-mannosidase isoform X1 [Orussus abietinus]|uniref:lysosomal alpha-mannosidase isoform X1 n=1 Tax=Orussus abietinus TaxID=222816 RepID=UPI0006266776|nr:lysosomal alpha-mannosidase isoform X1 [Orussus abietinus]